MIAIGFLMLLRSRAIIPKLQNYNPFMDLRTAGVVIQILKLMAVSDGSIASEEKEILESLSKRYLKEADIPSWTAAFSHPNDLEVLAEEIPDSCRALTGKLAYMVIASSRDAYQFTVNSDEQQAFARLCDTLGLDQDTQSELIVQAKNELAKRPALWDVLYSSFSSSFGLGSE
jgi:hypothetical protein